MRADPNRVNFERAVDLLGPLLDQLVFVGGCTTGLLITDSAAAGIRPTKDVDAIVHVTSYAEYSQLSTRLRTLGLREDTTENAPLCRWRYQGLVIDLMPTDASILGFTNRWYEPAIEAAQTISIGGRSVRVVDPVHFLATKVEAFHGRGRNDISMSHDLEDIVMVIDGRPELHAEVTRAENAVRDYIAREIGRLIANPEFMSSLPGFLLPDAASQARRALIESRLRALARL